MALIDRLNDSMTNTERQFRRLGAAGEDSDDEQRRYGSSGPRLLTGASTSRMSPFNHQPINERANGERRKRALRIVQEDELQAELKLCKKQAIVKNREAKILRDQVTELWSVLERTRIKMASMETNQHLLEDEAKQAKKRADRKDHDNKKLEEIIVQVRSVVKNLTETLSLNNEEQERLIRLFVNADESVINPFGRQATTRERAERVHELIQAATAAFRTGSRVKPHENIRLIDLTYTGEAYEQMMAELRLLPVPLFPEIDSTMQLERVNRWVLEWMRDRHVTSPSDDEPSSNPHSTTDEEEQRRMQRFVRAPITNGDGVTVVDVNPRTKDDWKELNRSLQSVGSAQSRGSGGVPMTLSADSAYHYTYLNAQFRQVGDVDRTIGEPLDRRWTRFMQTVMNIDQQGYTPNGQILPPRAGVESVRRFIVPFFKQFAGERAHSYHFPETTVEIERQYGATQREIGTPRTAGRPTNNDNNNNNDEIVVDAIAILNSLSVVVKRDRLDAVLTDFIVDVLRETAFE